MKENTLLEIVEAYVFDGVEVIINDGEVIGFEKVNYNNNACHCSNLSDC